NLFNILGILGVTAVIAPVPSGARFAQIDLPVAFAVAVALTLLLWRAGAITHLAGAGALAGYALYIGVLGATG
ncbi:sodium:calcium antiporter, partial [Cribrihabitans sp. XS_ASV171]